MEEILLSDKIKDYKIDFAERDADFHMDQFHYHPYYEIYFLLSGNCSALINHSIYHLVPGDFVLIPQSTMHRFVYDCNSTVKRYNLFFTMDFAASLFHSDTKDILEHLFHYPVLHLTSLLQGNATRLFDTLHQETTKQDTCSQAVIPAYISLILSLLVRNRDHIQLQDLDSAENAIQASARYISTHFQEPVSLHMVADHVHMSPTYYSKKFKQITGVGFKEYLTKTRLYEATELLTHTSLNVTEIAIRCGFNDGNYFGDAFRKEFGLSPLQYRKRRKNLL